MRAMRRGKSKFATKIIMEKIESLSIAIKTVKKFSNEKSQEIEYLEHTSTENEKEVLETRRKYCLKKIERSFKVAFKNKEVKLYSSMVLKCLPNTIRKMNKNLEAHPGLVFNVVYGVGGSVNSEGHSIVKLKNLVPLFDFFQALNMTSWEMSLLDNLSKSSLLGLVKIFKNNYVKYETPVLPQSLEEIPLNEEGDGDVTVLQFKNKLTKALFNCLSRHIKEIQKNRSWRRLFETAGVWGDLIDWKEKPLKNDERYADCYADVKAYSLSATRRRHFEMLFDNLGEFHNFIIVSADEKETPVHKEIIVLFSDYFYQVIKFGGTETRREGYLILENLEHAEVKLLVRYIYLQSFNFREEELMTGLKLLKEIMMYPNERKCQVKLIHRIVEITSSQIEGGSFFSITLPTIGFMFHTELLTFPKEVTEGFIKLWMAISKKSKETICKIIQKSFQKQEDRTERERINEKFEEVFKRIGKIEKSVNEDIDIRIGKIEESVTEIKSTLLEFAEEFRSSLKRKNEGGDEEARKKKIRKIEGNKDVSS